VTAALNGARQIIMERISEDAELLSTLRERTWQKGIIQSEVAKGKEFEATKFKDYFDFQEAINKIPSHRALSQLLEDTVSIVQYIICQRFQTCLTCNLCFSAAFRLIR
jgi:transcriptional accessory protein Tex/SPT6